MCVGIYAKKSCFIIDQEIDGKKIMVYNFCTNQTLAGDMSPKKIGGP